jgi:DNA topoisomerase VI subunit B
MGSKRQVFSETQMAQYFQADRLEKMAGRPQNDFHRVVVKELQDNALDAAESAGVAPEVGVQVVLGRRSYFGVRISDNGPGISQEVLDKL